VLAQPDPNLATLVEELTKFFADGPAAAQHLRNVRSEFRAKLGQSDYSDPFLKLQLNTRRKIFCERYHNLGNAYQHLERTHRLLAGASATGELQLANPDDFRTNDQMVFDLRFAVEDAQRAIAAGNDVPLLTQQLVLIAYILKDRERAISSFWDEFARYDGRSDTKTR